MKEISPLEMDGYKLWPDGSISVTPDNLSKMMMRVPRLAKQGKLFITEITPEIEEFNNLIDNPISIKTDLSVEFPLPWKLPDKYKDIDLDSYLIDLVYRIKKDSLYDERVKRLSEEICLFKQLQLDEVLITLIYIIDEFKKQGVVWGVGRGSSCSSYLLFLLGLHEVDAVKYDIEVSDFLRVP